MISKKSDDAISPVIGVMLMLVVTVVIAAAVTIFATGVVGETEAAPVAVLDVEILSSAEALEGMKGPELFITHLSGEPVDTKDIELRFSWTDDTCGESHYSTYSADGFEKEVGTGYEQRSQALYVKSTMKHDRTEYGSGGINHYFGDVILTPGLKLTATSEFLSGYSNTGSPFMDYVFDNYKSTSQTTEEIETWSGNVVPEAHDSNCYYCKKGYYCSVSALLEQNGVSGDDYCAICAMYLYTMGEIRGGVVHKTSECKAGCACETTVMKGSNFEGGIMDHLPAGTAVDVMIIHIPSGKAIYDNTVIVQ